MYNLHRHRSGLWLPDEKPRMWACDPGTVTLNCARMGLPMPFIAWVLWENAGNTAYDYSGNNIHNILTNCTWTPQGLQFNGSSSHASPGIVDFSDTDKITIFFTLTLNTQTGTNIVFELSDNYNEQTDSFIGFLDGDEKLNVGLKGPSDYSMWKSDVLIIGKKYKICCILDTSQSTGNEAKIYVDGILNGVVDYSAENSHNFGNRALYIGARKGSSYFAPIILDNIISWKDAFTLSQIATITNNPYGMFERRCRPPIWSIPSEGETFYKSLEGSLPYPSGIVTHTFTAVKSLSGEMPAPAGNSLKKISKSLVGEMPASTGATVKKVGKSLAGILPSPSGIVSSTVAYVKSLVGNFPAASASLSAKVVTCLSVAGEMPAAVGIITKKVGKKLIGDFPSAIGSLTKKMMATLTGNFPSPTGDINLGVKKNLAGIMGTISGVVSMVLNPVVVPISKVCKLVGSSFKKFIG